MQFPSAIDRYVQRLQIENSVLHELYRETHLTQICLKWFQVQRLYSAFYSLFSQMNFRSRNISDIAIAMALAMQEEIGFLILVR